MPWLDTALALWFATSCLACDTLATSTLCAECESFPRVPSCGCRRCGYPLPASMTSCGRCAASSWRAVDRAWAPLWYRGAGRLLLHRAKFQGRFEYLDVLRPAFLENVPPLPPTTVVVPVPMARARWFSRERNSAEIVGEWLAREKGLPMLPQLLQRRAHKISQSSLSARDRLRAVRSAFVATRPAPEDVCLVDDVLTTGATLLACAAVLRKAGARRVQAIALLRTELR